MKVLVTGAAGFIGHHVARRLAGTKKCEVLGVDNLSDYYDVALKRARLEQLGPLEEFRFLQADFADAEKFAGLMAHFKPDYLVHVGAQPGVRFSMEQPAAYTRKTSRVLRAFWRRAGETRPSTSCLRRAAASMAQGRNRPSARTIIPTSPSRIMARRRRPTR